MRKRLTVGLIACTHVLAVFSQESDTLRVLSIPEVVISENYRLSRNRHSTVQMEVVGKEFLNTNFSGNLMQTLQKLPGINSMNIGSGFSKPVIRGMGFNRVLVTENGIRQEGQQWGADHGLEIDAFNVEQVNIRKGPASLLYGSDAMGGVVEITPSPPPVDDQFFGEVSFLGKSVNGLAGGSVMLGVKKNGFHTRLRYSEQRFGDFRIPSDTIVYLTRRIPVYNRRLKNTAGTERNVNWMGEYRTRRYKGSYTLSNVWQKTGFFPGAHGIPNMQQVQDDGDYRNTELPYSKVNHLKAATRQQYTWDVLQLQWNLAWQNNHREEWSRFHTHYANQPLPAVDPDKELLFTLHTFSSGLNARYLGSDVWEHTAGWDMQYQRNRIAGYSFLLPEYTRRTAGLFWLTTRRLSSVLSASGGLRYDSGHTVSDSFTDPYLAVYLREQGYGEAEIEASKVRSHAVSRSFGDWSGSAGIVWSPSPEHLLKANIGRSFRLPGVNELASNGVHHGTFRHEQGDESLSSEKGWQLDVAYSLYGKQLTLDISPFVSWFTNYIYLRPTGEWSILPHAGQIYRYTGSEALFAGGEINLKLRLPFHLEYEFAGEYVYTSNPDEHVPLSFSPPGSIRNTLSWTYRRFRFHVEHHYIASQNRTDRNEDPTPGANLFNAGANLSVPFAGTHVDIVLSAHNLLNKRYYNHLSFYRKVEIPEPGRNFQIMIKIPFKTTFK